MESRVVAFGNGAPLAWPYPIKYDQEQEVQTDVLVLGGGISGCWAAIAAARKGIKVMLVEKGATIRSGSGGSGVDHWAGTADNPCCRLDIEEHTRRKVGSRTGYGNGITAYITSATGYETLLELEKMGGKIRDTEDEFKGAPFRDDETKLMFAYNYEEKTTIRVWGATFKSALYKECKRLGVEIYDRVACTSLLTENGNSGARVIGATGLGTRTGEFMIFKAKATILCMGVPSRNWVFSTELRGISSFVPPNKVGNGHAMAWRAGAELTMMERSVPSPWDNPYGYPPYGTGNCYNTWYPCNIVDAEDKEIPWVNTDGDIIASASERTSPKPGKTTSRSVPGQVDGAREIRLIPDLRERILRGEFKLPLYADLTSMPDYERRVIWGMMIGSEAKTKIPILKTYSDAGFDPEKDMLQSYFMLRGDMMMREGADPQMRAIFNGGGGLVVDWDLQSSLAGLFAAGEMAFATTGHAGAAATGRYAGAKAAKYVLRTKELPVHREQIEKEKARVYAPVNREEGIEWKELNAALCRIMQNYCGDLKTEELLQIGLQALLHMEKNEASTLCADNPHKLARANDVRDILTCDEIIVRASLARRASSTFLNFHRLDYPQKDAPDWRKWITLKLQDGTVKIGELPMEFWGSLKENYEAHCGNLTP